MSFTCRLCTVSGRVADRAFLTARKKSFPIPEKHEMPRKVR